MVSSRLQVAQTAQLKLVVWSFGGQSTALHFVLPCTFDWKFQHQNENSRKLIMCSGYNLHTYSGKPISE